MIYEKPALQNMVEIGTRIRELRQDRKMTQNDLAESVGCTVNTISRIELGMTAMNIILFIRIADALSTEPNDLMPSSVRTPYCSSIAKKCILCEAENNLLHAFEKLDKKERMYFTRIIDLYVNLKSD